MESHSAAGKIIDYLNQISDYSNKEEIEFTARLILNKEVDFNLIKEKNKEEIVLKAVSENYIAAANIINYLIEIVNYKNKEEILKQRLKSVYKVGLSNETTNGIANTSNNLSKIVQYFSLRELKKQLKFNYPIKTFKTEENILEHKINNIYTDKEKENILKWKKSRKNQKVYEFIKQPKNYYNPNDPIIEDLITVNNKPNENIDCCPGLEYCFSEEKEERYENIKHGILILKTYYEKIYFFMRLYTEEEKDEGGKLYFIPFETINIKNDGEEKTNLKKFTVYLPQNTWENKKTRKRNSWGLKIEEIIEHIKENEDFINNPITINISEKDQMTLNYKRAIAFERINPEEIQKKFKPLFLDNPQEEFEKLKN